MQKLILFILAISVFVSAGELILVRHESRLLFMQIQEICQQRDQLDVVWGQLQLEQSAWLIPNKIKEKAQKLNMYTPNINTILLVK
jgi:cell division protein FtsL